MSGFLLSLPFFLLIHHFDKNLLRDRGDLVYIDPGDSLHNLKTHHILLDFEPSVGQTLWLPRAICIVPVMP
jgi:hypothetical protein